MPPEMEQPTTGYRCHARRVVICLLMSCLMSASLILLNKGVVASFLSDWLKGWLVSFTISLPAILLLTPIADRVTGCHASGSTKPGRAPNTARPGHFRSPGPAPDQARFPTDRSGS